MLTCLREVRAARNLTLQQVADRCRPPTTAQTIGRLETGTRTVSLAWLRRIAAALDVAPEDLLAFPTRGDLPVVAMLSATGATAPRRPLAVTPPQPVAGQVAIRVTGSIADYRAGDDIWCDRLAPTDFATALNRDILAPLTAGGLMFGRLLAITTDGLAIAPLRPGRPQQDIPAPPWLALPVRLIRPL